MTKKWLFLITTICSFIPPAQNTPLSDKVFIGRKILHPLTKQPVSGFHYRKQINYGRNSFTILKNNSHLEIRIYNYLLGKADYLPSHIENLDYNEFDTDDTLKKCVLNIFYLLYTRKHNLVDKRSITHNLTNPCSSTHFDYDEHKELARYFYNAPNYTDTVYPNEDIPDEQIRQYLPIYFVKNKDNNTYTASNMALLSQFGDDNHSVPHYILQIYKERKKALEELLSKYINHSQKYITLSKKIRTSLLFTGSLTPIFPTLSIPSLFLLGANHFIQKKVVLYKKENDIISTRYQKAISYLDQEITKLDYTNIKYFLLCNTRNPMLTDPNLNQEIAKYYS